MSILLRRGMLLADKLYRPGDILPDIEEARILARRGDAEVIDEPATPVQKTAKPAKTKPTPEPEKAPETDGADNP